MAQQAPEFTYICEYCGTTKVTIRLEEVVTRRGTKEHKYVAREQDGSKHLCISDRASQLY